MFTSMLILRHQHMLTKIGFFGPAFNSEVYFGTFEFAQVFTGSLIWAVWPFGKSCESDDEVSRPYRRDSESGRVKLVA